MASVTITRQWPAGDALEVSINIDADYPDALNEARATATRCYLEALTTETALLEEPADEDSGD